MVFCLKNSGNSIFNYLFFSPLELRHENWSSGRFLLFKNSLDEQFLGTDFWVFIYLPIPPFYYLLFIMTCKICAFFFF